MHIESISIKNLRCMKDTDAVFDRYTCLVGPNGAGKSTLLCALNIFFRDIEESPSDISALTVEDFHLRDHTEPIEITVVFTGLSEEAKADFKDYVRQDKLVISAIATFDPVTSRAEVKQYGQRLALAAFAPFFKAYGDGAKVADLTTIFDDLAGRYPDVTVSGRKTRDAMYTALQSYESQHQECCELLLSEDQFYGVSRGVNRLQKYVQWIFIPAVKDATDEQRETKNGALGKLLARTVRARVNFADSVEKIIQAARQDYEKMLVDNKEALDEVSSSLRSRLGEWAHPDATLRVIWDEDPLRAVRIEPPGAAVVAGESGFEGELVRLGHGFQRCYLFALLQELASSDDPSAPTLILGCEEPELYQHPPQARHLSGVFERLSQGNSQVLLTTHSPYFVTGENFESVRLVRREGLSQHSRVSRYTVAEIAKRYADVVGEPLKPSSAALSKINQALQPNLNEMFFTDRLVLVEGLEDIAYIQAWMILSGKWEEYRRRRCHIVAVNGKSEMIRPLIIAQGLKIPVFAVIDADGDKIAKPEIRTRHHRDNLALIRLLGGDESTLFPPATAWGNTFTLWPSNLADIVEREFVAALGVQGREQFEALENSARSECGDAGGLDKNSRYIAELLSALADKGVTSASLDRLCVTILNF